MKKHIVFGTILIVGSFLLSLIFTDEGCGVCPGYANYNPTSVLLWLPKLTPPDPGFCRMVGCQPLQIPIFIDLILLGVILVGFGAYKRVMSQPKK